MTSYPLDLRDLAQKAKADFEPERTLPAVQSAYRALTSYLDIAAEFALWQRQKPLSPVDAEHPVTGKRHAGHHPKAKHGRLSLSERERECIQLAARGMSDREIGEGLRLSEKTVNEYIERVKRKFDVHTRVEAIVLAVKLNFIQP